ncbi:glyoxylate/hydroxypyruvate reductase HPR3-like [Euphorbia lathyris]|uniref:glyoxylate/hydroxypyruvate reductase HPR3-like n=1 Tax=Euphorbia lathyris TaxID=212925 RepID=UPI0033139377
MAAQNEQPSNQDCGRPKILLHRAPSFGVTFLSGLYSHFDLIDPLVQSPPPEFLLSARVLLCVGPSPLNSDALARLPSLQVIVGSSAGVDHIDLVECSRRGIAVTNVSSAFCEDVADCAVALLLDVLRRISAGHRYVRAGLWPVKDDFPLGFKLGSRRVGILGLGSIGSEIAKRLVPFGCRIAYTARTEKPSIPFNYYGNAHDLAANSDVLIVCCALTEETHHVVSKDVMTALGKEGVIINVGRGALLDEEQLVQFLEKGELAGAGLDVFENEPNVPASLFELDNVVLSPHCAVLTPESFEAMQDLVLANLKAFFSNQPLLSAVQID